MALATVPTFVRNPVRVGFDDLLFEICEELQLPDSKHELAELRYKTIGQMLFAPYSPFDHFDPDIYPQGSMRLGTTVRPLDGPFDLDFVCQLSVPYWQQNPMTLLDQLYWFFKASDRYRNMVEKKNRCVRLVYADDFYMDILPACRDTASGSTCIQVPDRQMSGWSGSNPLGYAGWFQQRSQLRMYKFAADRAMQPLPLPVEAKEKEVLQLVVQLMKRWRDLFYADNNYPPISIVLTTLAADIYRGETSTSEALLNILQGIVQRLNESEAQGRRLQVLNPVHPDEDFSERWDNRDAAYSHFDMGIRHFAKRWREIYSSGEDPRNAFSEIFGEVVGRVVEKRASRTQRLRENSLLGVKSSGVISSISASVSRMRPNTNHGDAKAK